MAAITEYFIRLLAGLTLDLMYLSISSHSGWVLLTSASFPSTSVWIKAAFDLFTLWSVNYFTFLATSFARQMLNVKKRLSFTRPLSVTELWYVHLDFRTATLFNKITTLVLPNLDHKFPKLSSLILSFSTLVLLVFAFI